MSYHHTPLRTAGIKKNTNVGKDVEKRESSYTIGQNVNWCTHYGKQYGSFSKLKSDLLCDPAIPLLAIHLKKKKKSLIGKDTCTLMFIAALFTIAKIWK